MQAILIIKTGRTVPTIPAEWGDFDQWITRGMGLAPEAVHSAAVYEGEELPPLAQVAGIVITGSPAMVTDRDDWSERSADYLRQAAPTGVPILGICYGHQLLCHALGGEVGYHPRGREMGTTTIELTAAGGEDPLLRGLPPRFPIHATHSQSILKPPPGAVLLGRNDFEAFHALRFGERIWGVQFHPEFNAYIMRAYIRDRAAVLKQEGMDPDRLRAEVREAPDAEHVLWNFAAIVRESQAQT